MEVKLKRRLSYTVIHVFMFISGVEYAIIFPTLWEYLLSLGVETSQTYWLGIVISAMTLTDMICSPIVGRLVDQTNNIRLLVIGLNIFQLVGALIYLISTSAYLLALSRMVSGCGNSISVVFLADICKSTTKESRTPVLLLFNIAFQIGLLLGPSLNILLQSIDIHLGSLTISKLNAPGLVILLIWLVFSIVVFLFYSNLARLRSEELLSDQLDQGYLTSETLENIDLQSHSTESDLEEREREDMVELVDEKGEAKQENEEEEKPLLMNENKGRHPPSLIVEQDSETDIEDNDDDDGTSRIVYADVEAIGHHDRGADGVFTVPTSLSKERSYRMRSDHESGTMPSATGLMSPIARIQKDLGIPGDDSCRNSMTSYGSFDSQNSNSKWESNRNPIHLLRRSKRKSEKYIHEAERIMGESYHSTATTTETEVFSSENTSISAESITPTWNQYKTALLRSEIILLLFIRFIAMFCQTSFESIVPPIMNTIFKFDDEANSYLYLAAGGELLVVYGLLSCLSRHLSDRLLVKAGMIIFLISMVWQLATIPKFTVGDRSYVKYFGIGAFIELLALPVVCDIGLALYSKLLPDNVQGLGHGVRRVVQQLAILLGPLFGAGSLATPLVLTAVPLVLQAVATVTFLLRYRKFKIPTDLDGATENSPLLA